VSSSVFSDGHHPVLNLLVVCGAMTVYVQATLDTAGKLLNASSLVPFITSMLCLTLVMNVLTTGKSEPFSLSAPSSDKS
jgi:hypothetical protein